MRMTIGLATCLGLIAIIGCSNEQQTGSDQAQSKADVDGSKFLLSSEPEGASDVIHVRESAKDGDDILIVGRIGGAENPWIDGRAAFSIVDGSLMACSDNPEDKCTTPWDYCCETHKLPTSKAFVKIVDKDGKLVKADARQLLNVKELSTVVVKGKAQRDDEGNLTVLASGLYIKKK